MGIEIRYGPSAAAVGLASYAAGEGAAKRKNQEQQRAYQLHYDQMRMQQQNHQDALRMHYDSQLYRYGGGGSQPTLPPVPNGISDSNPGQPQNQIQPQIGGPVPSGPSLGGNSLPQIGGALPQPGVFPQSGPMPTLGPVEPTALMQYQSPNRPGSVAMRPGANILAQQGVPMQQVEPGGVQQFPEPDMTPPQQLEPDQPLVNVTTPQRGPIAGQNPYYGPAMGGNSAVLPPEPDQPWIPKVTAPVRGADYAGNLRSPYLGGPVGGNTPAPQSADPWGHLVVPPVAGGTGNRPNLLLREPLGGNTNQKVTPDIPGEPAPDSPYPDYGPLNIPFNGSLMNSSAESQQRMDAAKSAADFNANLNQQNAQRDAILAGQPGAAAARSAAIANELRGAYMNNVRTRGANRATNQANDAYRADQEAQNNDRLIGHNANMASIYGGQVAGAIDANPDISNHGVNLYNTGYNGRLGESSVSDPTDPERNPATSTDQNFRRGMGLPDNSPAAIARNASYAKALDYRRNGQYGALQDKPQANDPTAANQGLVDKGYAYVPGRGWMPNSTYESKYSLTATKGKGSGALPPALAAQVNTSPANTYASRQTAPTEAMMALQVERAKDERARQNAKEKVYQSSPGYLSRTTQPRRSPDGQFVWANGAWHRAG